MNQYDPRCHKYGTFTTVGVSENERLARRYQVSERVHEGVRGTATPAESRAHGPKIHRTAFAGGDGA